MPPAVGAPVGFLGKLPARGDFVRRDLAHDFAEGWDAWLAAGIAASRAQLGEGWVGAFLEAPVWRFTLAAGVLGGAAGQGWAGLFFPSVDRAGRYFPLTLAASHPRAQGLLAVPEWFNLLQEVGVSALAEDVAFEAFEAAVAALPPPPEPPQPERFGHGLAGADPAVLLAASAPPVLFWTHGGARVAPRILALPTLPAPEHFALLLQDAAAAAAPPPVPDAAFPPGPMDDLLFGSAA
jgi:type VI secretion system protein ImpM